MNELSEAQGPLLLYHKGKEEQDMKYLKIFTDFLEVVEPLSDDERGRLFMAMLGYALDGSQPTLTGNERFVWAMARQHINREVAAYKTKVEAGREAGRRSGEARRKQTEPKGTKPNETNQDNDNDNDNNNNNNNDNDNDIYIAPAPKAHIYLQPPSLEEVASYCRERGNHVDPHYFHSYYESNGWRVGRNPMRDWKAAVRSWESNGLGDRTAQEPTVSDSFQRAMEMLRMEEAKQI